MDFQKSIACSLDVVVLRFYQGGYLPYAINLSSRRESRDYGFQF